MTLASRISDLATAIATAVKGRPFIPRPITNSNLMPWQVLGTSGAAVTSGKVTFHCIDVNNLSVQSIGTNCTTAQVGGTTTITLAIYPDNGRGNGPNLAGGPIASNTINAASTGNKYATITTQTLNGRYWLAFLYYVTSAPSTAPQFITINNAVQNTPGLVTGYAIGTVIRGYTLASQTAMPTTGTLSGSGTSDVVCCALRSAA